MITMGIVMVAEISVKKAYRNAFREEWAWKAEEAQHASPSK